MLTEQRLRAVRLLLDLTPANRLRWAAELVDLGMRAHAEVVLKHVWSVQIPLTDEERDALLKASEQAQRPH